MTKLTKEEKMQLSGGRIPFSFWGALAIADAIAAYYEGLEEGCTCAMQN